MGTLNVIVLSWHMNCVSKDLLSGIVYASNVVVVWSDLKECFDKVDCSRIFQIHREIETATQGTNSITAYFSKLRVHWSGFDSLAPVPECSCVKSRNFVEFMQTPKAFTIFDWI